MLKNKSLVKFGVVRNGTVVLTSDQAEEIYKCKLALERRSGGAKNRGQSVHVGKIYKVSPKTIRDIWNHITWRPTTCHLWRDGDACSQIPYLEQDFKSRSQVSTALQYN
jgi:hypothetical protein